MITSVVHQWRRISHDSFQYVQVISHAGPGHSYVRPLCGSHSVLVPNHNLLNNLTDLL